MWYTLLLPISDFYLNSVVQLAAYPLIEKYDLMGSFMALILANLRKMVLSSFSMNQHQKACWKMLNMDKIYR